LKTFPSKITPEELAPGSLKRVHSSEIEFFFLVNSLKQVISRLSEMSLSPIPIRHHWEDMERQKTLKEASVKEKHPESSFLSFHACNIQYEWLMLSFGIGSNMFKLLCIEVIFIYNI